LRSRSKRVAAINAATSQYRAAKSQSIPGWLTAGHRQEMAHFYRRAEQLTLETGLPYQVDHIVPLRGLVVCGLHVPWNLQVITKTENVRKSNRLLQRVRQENSGMASGIDKGGTDCAG